MLLLKKIININFLVEHNMVRCPDDANGVPLEEGASHPFLLQWKLLVEGEETEGTKPPEPSPKLRWNIGGNHVSPLGIVPRTGAPQAQPAVECKYQANL